ncbi:MAG: RNA polymerase ECF-type sigma factor [uncultured Thermomicrobiales bacterium]|uniref:RNA polymerase ECF-type sigma factor n=1 Tax=uncultured Thermomicrobiales bacterium TaxID=1645740 RepID=A0A6J4UDZ2_9BACT|nr:MAG: RNA polymerase ECF-type sigma factor [uncultured Thermomicrobiales bacterium]
MPAPCETSTSANPVPPDDEAAQIALAREDRRAFAPLYARYAVPVYRYCYRRLGSHEAAEDATAQTFALAIAALPRFRGGPFRAWLFTIAHNVVVDAHRRRRPALALDSVAEPTDAAPSPEDHALAAEETRSVQAVLARLPPDQRRVVELRLAGLTGPEIARVLGKRPGAVKSAQFRAYGRLRRLLGGPDHEETRRAG